jgi:glutathione S-transferase
MRLYHHPFSSNARRAVMTALHLGTKVDLVVVDLKNGGQRQPDYVRLNPNSKVPVLDDDGFVLWESRAIMTYLTDKTPGQTLHPSDPRARADVSRWLFWCANHWSPAIGTVSRERVIKPMLGKGGPDAANLERGETEVRDFSAVLDAHLKDREWVSGAGLTLADFSLAAPLMMTRPASLPLADRPNLDAWFARVQELDAWKRTAL